MEGRHIKRRGLRRSLSHDQPGRALRGALCKATGMVLHVSLPKATSAGLPASRPQVAATSALLLGACAPLDVRALWKPFFRETPNPPAQAFSAGSLSLCSFATVRSRHSRPPCHRCGPGGRPTRQAGAGMCEQAFSYGTGGHGGASWERLMAPPSPGNSFPSWLFPGSTMKPAVGGRSPGDEAGGTALQGSGAPDPWLSAICRKRR